MEKKEMLGKKKKRNLKPRRRLGPGAVNKENI